VPILPEAARRLVASPPGDFLELRGERIRQQRMVCSAGSLVDYGPVLSQGLAARVLKDGVWGWASRDGFEEAATVASRAGSLASSAGGRGNAVLPPFVPAAGFFDKPCVERFDEVPDREKAFQCQRYGELLSSLVHGAPCRVVYSERRREKEIVNSAGTDVSEVENICAFRFELPGSPLSVFRDMAGRSGYEFFRSREKLLDEVAAEYSSASDISPVESGRSRVILDPELTGMFVHEVFGHILEAGAHPFSPALSGMLSPGTEIAPSCVTIVDDATHYDMPGSMAYDDEGIPGCRKVLVSSGRVKSRLHSLATAGAAGMPPTGNGRAGSHRSPLAARMTCTYLAPGDRSLEGLLSMMPDGLLLEGALSGSTNMDRFRLTARKAWRIRSGKPVRPAGPCTIAGRILDTLGTISGAGSDLSLSSGLWGCSRPGYATVPVSYGGPYMLLGPVTIHPGV